MTAARIAIVFSLVAFATSAGALEFRGNTHSPLGAAVLALTGVPPGESLVVSNIGSSGDDGVLIEPAEPQSSFEITYATFASSGFTIQHRATDTAGGKSFIITSVQHAASEPIEYEAGGQAGDSYSTSFYSGPVLVYQSPPAAPGILAESVLIPQDVVLLPGTSGDAFSIEFILPVPEELVYVPEQQSFTGDRIVIERIETGGAAAGPPLSMDEIYVTAADLPGITISNETPAPASIPILGPWGTAILVCALGAARWRTTQSAVSTKS